MPSALAQGTLRAGTNRKKPAPASRQPKPLPPIPVVSAIDSLSLQKPCAAQAQNFSRRAPLDLEELTTANFSGGSPPVQPARPPLPGAFGPRNSLNRGNALQPLHPISRPPAAYSSNNQPRGEEPVLREVAARKPVHVQHTSSTRSQRPTQASAAVAAGRAAAARLATDAVPQNQKPPAPTQRAAPLANGGALKQQLATRTLRGHKLDPMPVVLAPPRPTFDPTEARSSYQKRGGHGTAATNGFGSRSKPEQHKRVITPVLEPANLTGNNYTCSQQRGPPVSNAKVTTRPAPIVPNQTSNPAGQGKKGGFWKSLFSFSTKPDEPRAGGLSRKTSTKAKILGAFKSQETPNRRTDITISRPRDDGHVFMVDSFGSRAEPQIPMPSQYVGITTVDDQARHDSICTTWGGIIQQAMGQVPPPPPKRPAPPAEAKKAPEKGHARDKSGSKSSKGRFIFERRDSDDDSVLSFKCMGIDDTKPAVAATKKRAEPLRCLNCGQPGLEEAGLCRFCIGNDHFFPTPVDHPRDNAKPRASVAKRRSSFSTCDARYVPRPASSVYSIRPSSQYTDPGNPFADELIRRSRAPAPITSPPSQKPRLAPLAQAPTATNHDPETLVSPATPKNAPGAHGGSLPSPASTEDSFSSFAFLKDADGNWKGPPPTWDDDKWSPRKSFWRRSRSLRETTRADEYARRDTDFYGFYDEVLPATPQSSAPRLLAMIRGGR